MSRGLGIFCIILSLICPTVWVVTGIIFNKNCGGYIKQAADANTAELAIERLDKAIAYAEAENLTDGYTSVFYKTEDDNIGFWYQNLLACRSELASCTNSSQLEKTNVLLKVRESLTDNGEHGTVITKPRGISRYPNNALMGIFMWLSIALFFFAWWLVTEGYYML